MSVDRQELLDRLKGLPEARLAELIFVFELDDIIATKASATERAIELIKAVKSQGLEAYERLVACVVPESPTGARPGLGASVAAAPARKTHGTQLAKHAPKVLFGRETELAALDAAWDNGRLNVYTLVAWGGAGKTSLVFHWVQTRFAVKDWPGVERYFDWSFYSQGTGESRQTSADLFIAEALKFFGDPDPTHGGPQERGERLAGLIRQHRTLLVLDGIEPLQYPPGDPQAGRLKDPALESLLRELAFDNPGLVVITTREHLTDLEAYATADERKLDKLTQEAAVSLLRHLQIVGTDEELHAAWQAAGGHALTLSLLGRFIADAYKDRDIRHYREVKFAAADREHQGRSAFKVMIAYERWLQSAGPERQRELAVLRLTGLFDRPMADACLQALRAEPAIAGLTDALVTLTEPQWTIAVKRLSEVELLSVSADAIDAHPLIREYFAAQLKGEQPQAFQAAHSRLFDYLCENTPHRPDGLDGLAPLYEAVTHGCLAGRQQEACNKVYIDRILRGTGDGGFYSWKKLGAMGADLAAVAAFFDEPWSQVSPNLTAADQAWLLNQAAYSLRALGRLTEALHPMGAGLEMRVQQKVWRSAAIIASNLSELEVTLGRLPDAVTDARQSITHADQSGNAFQRMTNRTTAADALHQSGLRAEAGALFAEAERLQRERQPQFNLLYSLQGFRYCDWLLAPAEWAAWQHWLDRPLSNSKSQILEDLADVERRANEAQRAWREIFTNKPSLLSIALDHLTLARVRLIRAILEDDPTNPQPTLDLPHVAAAVNSLRQSGMMVFLPSGLLTAALYHFVRGEPALAQKHLAEAQQIAERGPMPLFLADIHLTRARLFRDRDELTQAAGLIRTHGYGRRFAELADAERALGRDGSIQPSTTAQSDPRTLMTNQSAPRVFISYSHDSDDHRARVLGLSERLRADGIETMLDRYVKNGSPPEGWPRWMLNALDQATHVLCVCTETYYRRFRGQEMPGKGKGVDWEGALMTQSLYDARSVSNKFIPVLFARHDEPYVPEPLRAQTFYVLDSDSNYQALYDALLDQSGVTPGPIGTVKRKPRATGQPLALGAAAPVATNPAPAATSPAVSMWREKLDFLLVQEAVAVDPSMKFKLQHDIQEARTKIRELGGQP